MARYEIRIAHELDDELRATFDGFLLHSTGGITRVTAELDQAGLHGVLERLRMAGYDLLDARPVRPSPRPRS